MSGSQVRARREEKVRLKGVTGARVRQHSGPADGQLQRVEALQLLSKCCAPMDSVQTDSCIQGLLICHL